jgi:signal transduction histidine kinase
VQWSALTRILRELVSNAIAHARASRVDVAMELSGNAIVLSVADNGIGTDPQTWSHGLGLGGVRKRVKQLGGEVRWQVAETGGVECHVRVQLAPVPD